MKLLKANELKKYFLDRNYNCIAPHQIVVNDYTVFLTSGIQSILSDFRNSKINYTKKIYMSQPVIRTQFSNSISEGCSIAFTNSTTAGFNISEKEHNLLVKDWLELFLRSGINIDNISVKSKEYERVWGDLLVSGKKTFYYYNNLELGDTTFFDKITLNGHNIGIETMSDVGFGLERIRWCLGNESYFNIYSDTRNISPKAKAYISAIALLAVNNVKPANKNAGYRARLFSKKLAELMDGLQLSSDLQNYLVECIQYWKDWQENDKEIDVENIKNEYIRNCNRYMIDKLINEGYKNLLGININVPRQEFRKRLHGAGVSNKKIEELFIKKDTKNNSEKKKVAELER